MKKIRIEIINAENYIYSLATRNYGKLIISKINGSIGT